MSRLFAVALVLACGFLLTTKVIPWVATRLLRAIGFRAAASPVTAKRIARFKRIKRGYWSFVAMATLFVTSLFMELLVNGRAIVAHYDDHTVFPAVAELAGKVLFFTDISYFHKRSDFGQIGDSEVDYRRFARDCSHPELLRAEIDAARKKIADERAELERTKPEHPSMNDKIKLQSKEKAFKRRENELDALEKNHGVFAAGRAWCLMPIYRYGPNDFRLDDVKTNPPNSPSFEEGIPLGTDVSGRDVLVLLLYGFRISLAFALLIAAIGYTVAVMIGAIQGYYGGWVDIILQRLEEIWEAIPFLYVIMIIASLIVPTFFTFVVLMVVLVSWLTLTKYIRAEFYREKAKDYVQAAIGSGVSDWKIMTRHILPNSIVPIVTFAPFAIVGHIFTLVSLDFLGFGLPPGTPSWGNLLEQGLENVQFHPHLTIAPTIALVLTLLAAVMVGEAVREAFDPKVFSRLR